MRSCVDDKAPAPFMGSLNPKASQAVRVTEQRYRRPLVPYRRDPLQLRSGFLSHQLQADDAGQDQPDAHEP